MGEYSNLVVDHIVFILLAIVLPVLSLNRGEVKIEGTWDTKAKTVFYYSNSAVLWFGALFILGIWYFCGRSFTLFGFKLPAMNVLTLVFTSSFVILYIYQLLKDFFTESGKKKITEKWADRSNMMPSNSREFFPYCFLSFSAGITEEIIFRGFLMNYILALSPSGGYLLVLAAMLVPALIFGVIHIYQGIEAVQKIIIGGLLFGAIYYYSESLILVMVLHFLVDVITGYYLMKALQETEEPFPE